MKIILKGTEAELRSALHSFSVPDKVVSDNGSQFLCGDIADRGHKRKVVERTFIELKAIAMDHANRRRQVRQQLNSLSEQTIPEAVANYFKGNKLSVPFEKR